MESNKKDKIIIALIIVVVVLVANNFISKDQENPKINLFDSTESDLSFDDQSLDSEPMDDAEIKVHISGEIKNAGVYQVTSGDRLDDLIKTAGGLTETANTKDINLAIRLEDQMKIYIPSIYENTENNQDTKLPIVSTTNEEYTDGKVNINTASKEELMALPNIGEKRADAIIEYRDGKKFEDIDDIKNVTGIGEKFYQSLKDLITV